jgi:hypothetical protein
MVDNNDSNFMSRRAFVAAAGVSAASVTSAAIAAEGTAHKKSADLPPSPTNYGQSAGDEALREGWKQFCRRLEEAGDNLFKSSIPAQPLERADAFRYMMQNLGQSFALGFETKDTKYPVIHTFSTPFCKLGGDNADCVYQQAWIDGESVYKISGNKGTVRFFNITVQGPRPQVKPGSTWRPLMDPFGDVPEATLFGSEIETDWDGDFELYIGGPKRGPNWLPTTPGSRKLFIRQYFDAWSEESARIRIERVGMTQPRPAPTPADLVKAMDWASYFTRQNTIDWPDYAYQSSGDIDPEHINQFPSKHRAIPDPVYNTQTDKLRGRSGVAMVWRLAPDEAMILEWDKNDIFWMITNMGMMLNSMDYLYRPISYTPTRTQVDSDGKIRFVMAHTDPGYHNWIDTSGFVMGNLENRNIFTNSLTDIRTRVVKHADLATVMPADAAKVTPEERTRQMLERFHAITKRFML